jgi:predicted cupin superfamily sugar epimerase
VSFLAKSVLMTSIYFLITNGNFSAFHRIKSDELWSYHYGDALSVHIISPDGNYSLLKIGSNVENGEQLQGVVPAGSWFGSEVIEGGSYSLVGCVVAPGFDFEDFELAEKEKLIAEFPNHKLLIDKFCRR